MDRICDLTGAKSITNPEVIKAIAAAENGEVSEFELPDPDSL